jgi:ribosomal protein S18 acetylase RimI-like enzyme
VTSQPSRAAVEAPDSRRQPSRAAVEAPDSTIRSAVAADLPAVLELWSRARSGGASTPDDEASLRALLDRDPEALVVAERAGKLIGTLIAGWDGWRGNMYRLAVAPEHRRQGVAARLIAEGERRLRAAGGRRVTALVWREDARASAAWAAAGYEDDRGVARFVRNL